jgi:hypothetical protein
MLRSKTSQLIIESKVFGLLLTVINCYENIFIKTSKFVVEVAQTFN